MFGGDSPAHEARFFSAAAAAPMVGLESSFEQPRTQTDRNMNSQPYSTVPAQPLPAKSGSAPLRCLLCGGSETKVIDTFGVGDLRKAWTVFGVNFSNATWRLFNGKDKVEVFRCAACGFQFCNPELAGDGQFYADLERQRKTYYAPDVPEFHRTLQWARERKVLTALDIGCGEGAFLDLIRGAGISSVGIEMNLQAAEVCRKKGHTVHTRAVAELLSEKDFPRFDLVTVFQVLEHVPDPARFLSEAAQFLAPGGCLSVAVPNESGIYRICPREPHQWPPHHITRWRLEDLRRLGAVCGLRVAADGANRLLGGEAEHFWKLRNQIASVLGEKPLPGGNALPNLLSFLYRKSGMRYVVRGMGTSVYALYERSDHERR